MNLFSNERKPIPFKSLWGAFFTNLILWIIVIIYTDGSSLPLGAAILSILAVLNLIYPEKKKPKKKD